MTPMNSRTTLALAFRWVWKFGFIIKWQWLCLLYAVLFIPTAFTQNLQTRSDTLTGEQPFFLDLFVIPNTVSISIKDLKLDSSEFQFDPRSGSLQVPSLATGDTAIVKYGIWDLALSNRYTRVLESLPIVDSTNVIQFTKPDAIQQSTTLLRRSGSITRGILAGNNRNATIESGLRLQMSGQLAPDIHLRAALTDENTPILPEGTTQRLSELDRVFIEIDTPYSSAQLGDFQLRLDRSTFAQLNRKVQGIGITTPLPFGVSKDSLRAAGATSRGIFKVQDIQVKDGVQGPYRLQGNTNEPFILVIPGSESVYLDGVRLQRGESNDYVIDYATGELIFTVNRLIKYHHRIAVEFQYRTTEFTRTLTAMEAAISTAPRDSGPPLASFGITFIREADGKSFDQEFGLTDADKELLRQLGDQDASRSGATPVIYDPDAPWIHYTLQDTLIAGRNYSIYQPITEITEREAFRVEFTRVGQGMGDYVRQGQTANGIVYSYRGPQQGAYLPIRVLPKPTQQRMVDLQGSFAPIRYVEVAGEWAYSFRDENRFSPMDAADNTAHSYLTFLQIVDLPVGLGNVNAVINRRHTGKKFATFDRTQPVEFVRSWNLPIHRGLIQAHQETIEEVNLGWQLSDGSSVTGVLGRLEREDVFHGDRREIDLTINELGVPQLNYRFIHIESNADSVRGEWVRQEAYVSQSFIQKRLTIDTRLMTSRRHQFIPQGLRHDSQQYWEISPQIGYRENWGTLSAGFDWREEHLWASDYKLIPGRRTATTSISFASKSQQIFQSQGRLGLRYTSYTDFFQTKQGLSDERSVVIRFHGRSQLWNRLLRLSWLYEALSEQTPVLQEIYIRTGPELGEYVWNDANGNGILEIDEFIPEVTQDEGEYARTLIPSDSLQSVTGLKTRLNIQFEGRRHWSNSRTTWQKWLRHITLRSSLEVQEKSTDPHPVNIYLLRQHRFRHPEYSIRGTLNMMQDLWLFRNHPQYGFHVSWRKIRSANVFAAETERRSIDEFRAQIRWSLGDLWTFTSEGVLSDKMNNSTTFTSRDFDIQTKSVSQETQVSIKSNIRLSTELNYSVKNSKARGKAVIWKLPIKSSWDRAGRTNISGRFEFAHTGLSGGASSIGLALFELTDGRGAGRSLLWQLNGWIQLTNTLRTTISYSGRSPQNAPQIHTVRMQLSATF
ncbi:MAG: hypothetical protein OXF48_07390 [Bacteroidetes bacterium]|nr:hypothetical protein [Bacteroidota bacterium]